MKLRKTKQQQVCPHMILISSSLKKNRERWGRFAQAMHSRSGHLHVTARFACVTGITLQNYFRLAFRLFRTPALPAEGATAFFHHDLFLPPHVATAHTATIRHSNRSPPAQTSCTLQPTPEDSDRARDSLEEAAPLSGGKCISRSRESFVCVC